MVHYMAVSICCSLEEDTLSALLQSTQLINQYQMGEPLCYFFVFSYPENTAINIDINIDQ